MHLTLVTSAGLRSIFSGGPASALAFSLSPLSLFSGVGEVTIPHPFFGHLSIVSNPPLSHTGFHQHSVAEDSSVGDVAFVLSTLCPPHLEIHQFVFCK